MLGVQQAESSWLGSPGSSLCFTSKDPVAVSSSHGIGGETQAVLNPVQTLTKGNTQHAQHTLPKSEPWDPGHLPLLNLSSPARGTGVQGPSVSPGPGGACHAVAGPLPRLLERPVFWTAWALLLVKPAVWV